MKTFVVLVALFVLHAPPICHGFGLAPTLPILDADRFRLHKAGVTADMLYRAPSIAGAILLKNWTPNATRALESAVESVVEQNPSLTGHVYRAHCGELWVKEGTFQEFFQVLDPPQKTADFASMNERQILDYVQTEIFSILPPCQLTSTQAQEKRPLFSVSLIHLPNNHAIWSLKMSHAIGDGVTFFMLLKQISMCMSGQPAQPLEWTQSPPVYPPWFSKRDVHLSYGPPFVLGAIRNVLSQTDRKVKMLVLDKKKISETKRAIRKLPGCSHVSANDVITSAICASTNSSDVFIVTENLRGREQGIPMHAAGNFLWEVPIPKQVAIQPQELSQVVQSHGGGYPPNKLPVGPFCSGRVARITSMATITESFVFEETKPIATLPDPSFLQYIPMDVALIFRYNRDYWGILHNIADFEMTPLLKQARL